MEMENPLKFTEEQQKEYIKMRTLYKAQRQIEEIINEIVWIKLKDGIDMMKADPMAKGDIEREKRVVSYSFNSSTSLDLDEENQRKIFEQVFNPFLQVPLENFDEAKEERLKKSFVRREILKSLGFGEPPRVFANWREDQVGKEVSFRIAQSPKDKSFFLIQTIINGDGHLVNKNLLSENILFVPDEEPDKTFEKAVKYWKEKVIGQKSPALTSQAR